MKSSNTRTGGVLKKLLLGGVALVVILAAAAVFLAPTIVSGLVPGIVSSYSKDNLQGQIEVKGVKLGWGAPITIDQVTVRDPGGNEALRASASVQTGLWRLITGSMDFGEIRLKADADLVMDASGRTNLEEALAAKPGRAAAPSPTPPSGPSPGSQGAPSAISLPKGLKFNLVLEPSSVKLRPKEAGQFPVKDASLTAITGSASVAPGAPIQAELNAQPVVDGRSTEPLKLALQVDRVIQADGTLKPGEAVGEIGASIALPQVLADYIAARAGLIEASQVSAEGGIAGGIDGAMRLTAAFTLESGRLKLAQGSVRPGVAWRLPRALTARSGSGAVTTTLEEPPVVSFTLTKLDLPVGSLLAPAPGQPASVADWRGGSFDAQLEVSGLSGTVVLGDGAAPRRFTVKPTSIRLSTADLAGEVAGEGGTTIGFEGAGDGSARLALKAKDLLDANGAFKTGLPGWLDALVELRDVPSAVLDPLLAESGLSLQESAGPTINLALQAATGGEGGSASAASASGTPPITLSMVLQSERLEGGGSARITEDRIVSLADGFEIKSSAARALIEGVAKDLRGRLSGTGLAAVSVRDLDVPLNAGKPDFSRLRASMSASAGGLSVRAGEDPAGPMVEITSLDTTVSMAPEAAPKAGLDWRLSSGGKRFAIRGALEAPGLIAWTGKEYPHLEVTADKARPQGKIELIDVPMELAGLASAQTQELARAVIGPTLAGVIEASPSASGGTNLTMLLVGEKARVQGAAALEGNEIRVGAEGLTAELKDPAGAANAIVNDANVRFGGAGTVKVALRDVTARLPGASGPFSIEEAAGTLRAEAAGLTASLRDAGTGRVNEFTLASMTADAGLAKGGALNLTAGADGEYGGQPMRLDARAAIATLGALMKGAIDDAALRGAGLEANVKAARVPTAVAALAAPEHVELVREMIGETIDLELTASKGSAFDLKLSGERVAVSGSAALEGGRLSVKPIEARATLTPGSVRAALRSFAKDLADPPALAQPVTLAARTEAFSLSMDAKESAKPLAERIGALNATLRAEGDIEVSGIALEGGARKVGALVRGLAAEVKADGRNLADSLATLSGELFNPAEPGAALAKVEARAGLSAAPLNARATLSGVNTAALDRWLGKDELLAGVLGDRADISAVVVSAGEGAPMRLDVDVRSPGVTTALRAERSEARTALLEPAVVQWTMTESWANRYVFPPDDKGVRPLAMKGSAPVRLDLKKLAIGATETPLQPGVFDLDLSASVPAIQLVAEGNRALKLSGITATGTALRAGSPGVQFALGASEVASTAAGGGGGGGGSGREVLRVTGQVADLADGRGALTTDRARLTLDAKGAIPTPIIDAMGRSGTTYTALLGPTTEVDLTARDLSRTSGTLRGRVQSENSAASVAGSIDAGRFSAEGPVKASLTRITPEASRQIFQALIPFLESFEKTAEDQPATVDAEGLTVPIDGDMTKLNGVVRLDLGTLRFKTSTILGQLLDMAKVRSQGAVGQRIEPFVVRMTNGIATYDRFKLPLGEFSVETEGTIDLNRRQMDTMVYIPFFAVSRELSALINNDLTGKLTELPIIGDLTMVPVRVAGSLDKPRTEFAADAFIKDNVGKAVEKGLKDVIEKGLDGLFKKKN